MKNLLLKTALNFTQTSGSIFLALSKPFFHPSSWCSNFNWNTDKMCEWQIINELSQTTKTRKKYSSIINAHTRSLPEFNSWKSKEATMLNKMNLQALQKSEKHCSKKQIRETHIIHINTPQAFECLILPTVDSVPAF